MRYKQIENLPQYLILAFFMVFPGIAIGAQTTDESKINPDIVENALPPIDRKMPKIFDSASFGLG